MVATVTEIKVTKMMERLMRRSVLPMDTKVAAPLSILLVIRKSVLAASALPQIFESLSV